MFLFADVHKKKDINRTTDASRSLDGYSVCDGLAAKAASMRARKQFFAPVI